MVAEDEVARFVERFALFLANAGMARMPARVFARLLVTESGQLTAAGLAESLQVSPAAVSGAVRYLEQVGLIRRGREPGERRDHYAVTGSSWMDALVDRDKMMADWAALMGEGAVLLGPTTAAGERLAESERLFLFLKRELADMLRRFREGEAAREG
ncbi:GbsR/MarR family transcriptional regulator [Actinokineospora bangkokensis]|uniref:MarR family transcriptional regulator n=1 Tax=Actinokineospora bangkokensis TaxID=1193682 RepID=A0A1Q9LHD8_9PSEU|nr:MarR family transcriptional regulator [Actinokineospora bangkokensis]OLR91436.1 MarR family transcriptional regulator [Actinokineospora bangkokensis]